MTNQDILDALRKACLNRECQESQGGSIVERIRECGACLGSRYDGFEDM